MSPRSPIADAQPLNTYTEPPRLLAAERARTDFPVRELTYYFDGGKEETEAQEAIFRRIERDPVFRNDDFYDWTDKENRERTFRQVGRLHAYLSEIGLLNPRVRNFLAPMAFVNPSAQTRFSVHLILFTNTILGQGTEKQIEYWKSRGCFDLKKFYGCYGMTELGHGSNVAGIETTATYDKKTQEFVINTPHTAATKWWIGGAAHSSNHTVCFARLIVDGKDYGVHSFVVQLRDIESHSVLPGIAVGDIGKKMGRDGIDNGWIQFTNVRIPRTHMLMRYSQVTPEGKVIESPLAQLTYGSLINGRVMMANDSWTWAKRFLTIAIRYAAARRQFSNSPNSPEVVLLDYQHHQRRLMPLLADAVAIHASAVHLTELYDAVSARQKAADPSDREEMRHIVNSVKQLFELSACLKAYSTWSTCTIIDECRQACGGSGYSSYTGFGAGYNDWVVNCTWEGDNNVLCLTAGRALVKSGLAALRGEVIDGAASYLNDYGRLKTATLGGRNICDPAVQIEAWDSVTSHAIIEAAEHYNALIARGLDAAEAFEDLAPERIAISRLHTYGFQVRSLYAHIDAANPALHEVLTRLATLFVLSHIEKEANSFLRYGFLTSAEFDQVVELQNKYCGLVRSQAIGITDAFNLSDFFINSPIGNYDGDVYKNYFTKTVERAPADEGIAPYVGLQLGFFHRKDQDIPPLTDI